MPRIDSRIGRAGWHAVAVAGRRCPTAPWRSGAGRGGFPAVGLSVRLSRSVVRRHTVRDYRRRHYHITSGMRQSRSLHHTTWRRYTVVDAATIHTARRTFEYFKRQSRSPAEASGAAAPSGGHREQILRFFYSHFHIPGGPNRTGGPFWIGSNPAKLAPPPPPPARESIIIIMGLPGPCCGWWPFVAYSCCWNC